MKVKPSVPVLHLLLGIVYLWNLIYIIGYAVLALDGNKYKPTMIGLKVEVTKVEKGHSKIFQIPTQ